MSAGCGYGGGAPGCPNTVPLAVYSNNQYRFYADTWYDDPIRIAGGTAVYGSFPPVNEELNAIEYTPGGGCIIASGTTGWISSYSFFLGETGWYRVSFDWEPPANSITCNQNMYSENTSHLQNTIFCALAAVAFQGIFPGLPIGSAGLIPTDVYYQPNQISGDQNGVATPTQISSKSGTCSILLAERDTWSAY